MSANGSFSSEPTSFALEQDQIQLLSETFDTIDLNGDGVVSLSELQLALKIVGIDLPGYQVRELVAEYDKDGNRQTLTFSEFSSLYEDLKRKTDVGRTWAKEVKKPTGVIELSGETEASQLVGVKHSVRVEEQIAFSDWINSNLSADPDLRKHLPIEQSENLYNAVKDGLVLCKLINLAVADTIDERVINKGRLNAFTIRENQTLALNSAQAIGCNIVNIDADDLAKGKKHLVLGLLWQIIRIGLFSKVDLKHVPGLVMLARPGETLADLQKLSPEEILMRWVNYHLEKAGVDRRLTNFTSDIQDSVIYTHLLNQIAPNEKHVTKEPLFIQDLLPRADAMLQEADKLGCRSFVTPKDVVNQVYKLNLAFVANLFNTWPALDVPSDEEIDIEEGDVIEETREEKTYRNWMNSMGVQPFVNWLYADLCNGVIIFQLYDIIKPNLVNWKRVVTKFKKLSGMMDQIQNCNYAVDLGKQLRFSLVGIQGKDIYDGNRTLTLGLVWQLMRAYTLTILAQCTHSGTLAADKDIVEWVNKKLQSAGKSSSIRSFQDSSIANGLTVCDLIDAIQPGVIDYSVLKHTNSESDNLSNAKYAITVARKIGAKVYALPEDIVEVKPKMVMTVFACLMARDYLPDMREQQPLSPGISDTSAVSVSEPIGVVPEDAPPLHAGD